MTTFVLTPDNSYVPIAALRRVWVGQDIFNPLQNEWFIFGSTIGMADSLTLKGPIISQVAAQSQLANAIVALGGAT